MPDKTIRRRRAVLALLVAASIVLLTASFGGSSGVSTIQRGVFEVISPIQDGASRALKPVRDLFGWAGDTLHAKRDNKALRAEVDTLRQQLVLQQDNGRLLAEAQKQLELNTNAGLTAMGPKQARVTVLNPSLFLRSININLGSSDGLQPDQPVMTGTGLVGKVAVVTPNAAKVTLLTDSSFEVGARIARTGVTGIVRPATGDPNDMVMDFTAGAAVQEGQVVVTSGTVTKSRRLGSPYPRDIPIGKVTRVAEQGTDQQVVHLRPFVSLRRLNYVQVLTRVPDGAPS